MSSSSAPSGELIGSLQPTRSRLPISRVWALTTRPGPATYLIGGSMGKQPDSRKAKYPQVRFGREERGNAIMDATYSKGPIYQQTVSMGRQADSRKPTNPRAHFGTSSRAHHDVMYSAYSYKPH